MNKKILIGSIIAICILIGVSFTSVVGYNSIESDKKLSPLFNIRTQRAIDEESEELSFEYVGKGNNINLLIPSREDNTVLIQKIIDIIRSMEEKTFEKFIEFFIDQAQNDEILNDVNPGKIIKALYLLRNNEESILIDKTKRYIVTYIQNPKDFLICLLLSPFIFIATIFGFIGAFFLWCINFYHTFMTTCTSEATCECPLRFTIRKLL